MTPNVTTHIRQALAGIKAEEKELQARLDELSTAKQHLHSLLNGKPARAEGKGSKPYRLSPKGRANISRAAKKRWAKYRRENA